MKKPFAILAAVLVTLCTSSTALAETPPPTPVDVPQITVASVPTPYYVAARAANEAPRFTRPLPTRIEVFEGTNVLLRAEFSGAKAIEVFWFCNGRLLDPVKDLWCTFKCGSDFATLYIDNIYLEDSGVYSLQIVNDYGLASTYVTLDVKEKN